MEYYCHITVREKFNCVENNLKINSLNISNMPLLRTELLKDDLNHLFLDRGKESMPDIT